MYVITNIDSNEIIKIVSSEEEAKEYVQEHPGTFYSYFISAKL